MVRFALTRLCILLVAAGCFAQASAEELTLALEPFLSPRTLIGAFQSFRNDLSEKLGVKVVLVTAPNYDQYAQRLLNSEFDLAIIGPHTALLAQQQAGYVPLAKGDGALKAVVIVKKSSRYQSLADLKGELVALPDHLTMTSMMGAEMLKAAGLSSDDIKLKYNDFHNTAAMMMLGDQAAAAIVADSALLPMAPEIKNNIRVLSESQPVPQMVLLAHSRLDPQMRERILARVADFLHSIDPKKSFLARVGFASTRPLDEQDVKTVKPYVDELKRRLGR